MVRLFSCRIPPSLLRQRAWEKDQRGTENSPAPCASDRYCGIFSSRISALSFSCWFGCFCSAAIRFCPLCEESISTAVKSVSSNRPGSKLWDRIVAVRQRGLEPGEVASVVGPAE